MENDQFENELYPEKILDQPPETDAVEDFSRQLLNLENRLIALEADVTQFSPGLTGFIASQKLSDLEECHRKCIETLINARYAVLRERLDPIGKCEYENEVEFKQLAGSNEFDEYINRLNRLAGRTDRRLSSRRTSINMRMGLTISLIAVVISTFSLFHSVVSINGVIELFCRLHPAC